MQICHLIENVSKNSDCNNFKKAYSEVIKENVSKYFKLKQKNQTFDKILS